MDKQQLMHQIFAANREIVDRGITFINEADEEEFVSYRQLYERSLCLLQDLRHHGVQAGHELLLQIQDNRLFLEVFWACILGRIIAVPVTVATNDETKLKVNKVWGKLSTPHIIGSEATMNGLASFAEEYPECGPSVDVMKARFINIASLKGESSADLMEAEPEDIAFIQFSSGSTGDPKGVVLTHSNVMANVAAMQKVWNLDAGGRVLSWMPLTHDMGLIAMHLLHAYTQSSQFIMRTKLFILNPLLWIEKANRHRINMLYSPNFGYKYFLAFYDQEHDYGWDLSGLSCLCNGAEPISTEISERFMEQLAKYNLPQTAMRPAYGLAEGTVGVCFTPQHESFKAVAVDRRFLQVGETVRLLERGELNSLLYVDVGGSIESCEVMIADEQGSPLPMSTVGYILIKGPSVTRGYYNEPEAAERLADGWLNTADIGFMLNGRLVVVGRAKDILFVNGQNVFSHDIERVAEEVDGVELWNVAACGTKGKLADTEEACLFLLYRGKNLEAFCELASRVKQHIHRKMGIFVDHVIPVKSIPKTTSGKIQRYKLGEQYTSGQFDSLIRDMESIKSKQAASENTEQLLLRLCQDLLGRELGIHDHFNESGGNSLILTQLSDELEKWHGCSVSVPDLYKYPTIAKLTAFIDRGGSLSLPSVSMDEAYFNKEGSQGVSAFEAELDTETCSVLQAMADEAKTDLKHVLLSGFLYLLKLASGEDTIHVQVAADENQFRSLTIDFAEVDSLETLIELAVTKLEARNGNEDGDESVYTAKDLDRIQQSEELRILPLFVIQADAASTQGQWLEVFDLVIELAEYDEQVEVLCGFNSRKLKEHKIKELFTQYMLLLADIVENSDKVSV